MIRRCSSRVDRNPIDGREVVDSPAGVTYFWNGQRHYLWADCPTHGPQRPPLYLVDERRAFAVVTARDVSTCRVCGGPARLRDVIDKGAAKPASKRTACGPRCLGATGPACDCRCKGRCHKAGVCSCGEASRSAEPNPPVDFKLADIQARFDAFNQRLFDGALPRIPLRLARLKHASGTTNATIRAMPGYTVEAIRRAARLGKLDPAAAMVSVKEVVIGTTHRYDERELDGILLHEMIHVQLMLGGYPFENHGLHFLRARSELVKRSGIQVPLTHDVSGAEIDAGEKEVGLFVVTASAKEPALFMLYRPAAELAFLEKARSYVSYFHRPIRLYRLKTKLGASLVVRTKPTREFFRLAPFASKIDLGKAELVYEVMPPGAEPSRTPAAAAVATNPGREPFPWEIEAEQCANEDRAALKHRKYAYHRTEPDRLESIRKLGLIPRFFPPWASEGFDRPDEKLLFFTDTPHGGMSSDPEVYGDLLLRVPFPSDAKPWLRTTFGSEYTIDHPVPPKDIEALLPAGAKFERDGRWTPLAGAARRNPPDEALAYKIVTRPGAFFVEAREGRTFVGSIDLDAHAGSKSYSVGDVFVNASHRGRGVGLRLYVEAAKHAARRGYRLRSVGGARSPDADAIHRALPRYLAHSREPSFGGGTADFYSWPANPSNPPGEVYVGQLSHDAQADLRYAIGPRIDWAYGRVRVERRRLADLDVPARPAKRTEAQWASIRAGVAAGKTPPLIVKGRRIIEGNHRARAALDAGLAALDVIDVASYHARKT